MDNYKEHCCKGSELKRPCRCGGKHFVEPKMKVTNCFPKHCRQECSGCRCCCECMCPCCDRHPCRCQEVVVTR